MAAKDYSFEPVGTVEPNEPVAEAVPSSNATAQPGDEEVSDTAIMVGCGTLGWAIGGPFLAIITALGGKYLADKKEGPFAESCKSVGKIAAATGRKAKDEHLWCKIKAAIRSLFTKKECRCENCNCSIK